MDQAHGVETLMPGKTFARQMRIKARELRRCEQCPVGANRSQGAPAAVRIKTLALQHRAALIGNDVNAANRVLEQIRIGGRWCGS